VKHRQKQKTVEELSRSIRKSGGITVDIRDQLTKYFAHFGILGSLAGLVLILGSMVPYVGTEGEAFSIFNHYVSELGEIGVSEAAVMFNVGLMVAGFLFIPFMVGLSLYLKNYAAYLAGTVGVFTSLSIVLVGVFPMNYSFEHGVTAMSFFLSGMVMVVLWAIAIVLQESPKISKVLSIGGVINFVCFAGFLYWAEPTATGSLRPDFSWRTTLEWAIYFAIIGYLFAIALYVWIKGRATESSSPL
jgi:hypothetical membrane protein